MRREACPGELQLARAMTAGADAALAEHMGACGGCRAAWDGQRRAIELARQLPVEVPSPAHRDEVRAALLATAGAGAVRAARAGVPRLAWISAAAVVAALVAAVSVGGGGAGRGARGDGRARGDGLARSHARVRAEAAADYAVVAGPPEETLRLRDGSISVEVEPLGPGERFRVVVGGDEIEVRGTAFELVAARDRLVAVRVARGRVEVRPASGRYAVLGAGQSWQGEPHAVAPPPATLAPGAGDAPAAADDARPAPPRPARPSRARASRSPSRGAVEAGSGADREAPSGPRAREAQESLYNDAWDAMRAGEFAKAASAFGAVIAVSPAGPLADEGAYWRAVALARGGAARDAIAAFRELLDHYSSSPRRGEASAMLGWLLLDARQNDEAERRFRAAAADPSEIVRTSARKGLDALASGPR